jgi:hypothetical protein
MPTFSLPVAMYDRVAFFNIMFFVMVLCISQPKTEHG